MALSNALSPTLHLVACSPETRRAIADATLSRELRITSFPSLDDYSRSCSRPKCSCDCVVLESLSSPSLDLASLIELRRKVVDRPILLLLDRSHPATQMAALRCGATDVFIKPVDAPQFLNRLDDIFTATLSRTIRIDRPEAVAGLSSLTHCERRVLEFVLSAMTIQQISRAMHVGTQTVAKHKQRVLRKLGARNDVELVLQILGHDRHPGDCPVPGEGCELV